MDVYNPGKIKGYGSELRSQLGVKLGFAIGEQHDLELALLRLGERRAFDLLRMAVAGRVLHLELTAAAQLDAVVEAGTRGQTVGSKTGAGIIDFEQLNCCSGAVFDRGFNLIGVAAGGHRKRRQQNCGQNSFLNPAS